MPTKSERAEGKKVADTATDSMVLNTAGASPHESVPASGAGASSAVKGAEGKNLVQQAKETTTKVVDQVQQQATSRFDQQKENAANELTKVVDAVREMGRNLSGEEEGTIVRYAADYGEKAAAKVEQLTNYLRQHNANELLSEVEDVGRRRPAFFIGGALLLGFVGARFLKSSTQATSEASYKRALPQQRTPVNRSTTVPGV